MNLSTKHILLRAVEPEDLELLYTIENDCELWDFSTSHMPYSKYTLKQYIANNTNDIYIDKQLRLIAEETQSREVVGIIDLSNFDAYDQRVEIGIVVLKQFRNKGYASQMIELLENYICHTIPINQLYAMVPISNTASIKLFESLGYLSTAKLQEWARIGSNFEDILVFQKNISKKMC